MEDVAGLFEGNCRMSIIADESQAQYRDNPDKGEKDEHGDDAPDEARFRLLHFFCIPR